MDSSGSRTNGTVSSPNPRSPLLWRTAPVAYCLAAYESVQEAVFQVDLGPFGSVRREPHLDLAGVLGIGVVPPLAVDLPGDDQPVRRIPGQHPTPVALAAVHPSFVPPSTFVRLQDGLSHFHPADVELSRPPGVE